MDPAFFGTWEHDQSKSTNVENLCKAMGMDDAKTEMYKKLAYTYKITPEGDSYRLTTDFKGGLPGQDLVVKLGEEKEYTSLEGEKATMTMEASGNTVVEKHVVSSKNQTVVITRTVNGNTMTYTVEVGGTVVTGSLNRI